LAVVGVLLLAPWAAVPAYEFPSPTPFSGETWRNPYQGLEGPFLKVNLHAHTKVWAGLTAGGDSIEAMAREYALAGYDALAVSNYHQRTSKRTGPLAMLDAYEHGFNFTKSHRLVLGGTATALIDFPVSTRSMRQWVLDVLGENGEAVVGLSHPSLRGGHDCDDVQTLTGFQLFEVHNPYATSLLEWDCALSAGRLSWAVGNDDAHHARARSVGVAWNMIAARSADQEAILDALRSGRSYVVRGERGMMDVTFQSLRVENGVAALELSGPARVEWVVDGSLRQHDNQVARSEYRLMARDRYVRAVVYTPISELVLQPLTRSDGGQLPRAEISWWKTGIQWAAWVALALATSRLLRRPALQLIGRSREHMAA
jgi:hypothetical protein